MPIGQPLYDSYCLMLVVVYHSLFVTVRSAIIDECVCRNIDYVMLIISISVTVVLRVFLDEIECDSITLYIVRLHCMMLLCILIRSLSVIVEEGNNRHCRYCLLTDNVFRMSSSVSDDCYRIHYRQLQLPGRRPPVDLYAIRPNDAPNDKPLNNKP